MKSSLGLFALFVFIVAIGSPVYGAIDQVEISDPIVAQQYFSITVNGTVPNNCWDVVDMNYTVDPRVIDLFVVSADISDPHQPCSPGVIPYEVTYPNVTVDYPTWWTLRVIQQYYPQGGGTLVPDTLETVFWVGSWSGEPLESAPANLLHDAYPNPFNPITTIAVESDGKSAVSLAIHDLAGRLVRTLIDGESLSAGRHERTWNGTDDGGLHVAAGVYLYRFQSGTATEMKRVVLVK